MSTSKKQIHDLATLSMLVALMAILTFVPMVGFIQIPPLISITIMHIPVIIGAVLLGPKYGGILGGVFGLMSMLKATFFGAGIADFIFSPFLSGNPVSSIIMCFIPRILLGVIAGGLFLLIKKKLPNELLSIGISAAIATLFHSLSVLTLMFLLFKGDVFDSLKAVFATAFGLNGILELVVAVILSTAVCKVVFAAMRKKRV